MNVEQAVIVRNFVESNLPMQRPTNGCIETKKDRHNHLEVRVSQGRIELWGTDRGIDGCGATPSCMRHDTFRLMMSAAIAPGLPFTRGYWHLQHAQYNASKFCGDAGSDPSRCGHQTYHWDNIAFDGPVLPALRSYSHPDAMQPRSDGVNLGYELNASERTFTFPGVDVSGIQRAALAFNIWPFTQIRYRVNGGTQRTWTHPGPGPGDGWRAAYIPLVLSELHAGTNTIALSVGGETVVSNLDLILEVEGQPSTPTPTPTPTSTPTASPTATPTSTATSTPTGTPMPTLTPTVTMVPTTTPTLMPTSSPPPSPTSTIPPSTQNRVRWEGRDWYLYGANLPWYNWGCDLGCGTQGGMRDPTVAAAVEQAFRQARDSGMHVVRWWAFPGEALQITRASDGRPTGITSGVTADIDAALALAARYDIYLNLVLFSDPRHVPLSWWTNPDHRTAMIAALRTLVQRYAGNPRLLMWELVNEPDFAVYEGALSATNLTNTVREWAAMVDANSDTHTTIGMGFADGLQMVVGTGLTVYQAHWYDYMNPGVWCMRCNDAAFYRAMFNLDKPLVVGEFPTGSGADARARWADWEAKDYAGAWAWSLLPGRTDDAIAIDHAQATAWAAGRTDTGPRGVALPTPTPTATATGTPATYRCQVRRPNGTYQTVWVQAGGGACP